MTESTVREPDHLKPFVLETGPTAVERHGPLDLRRRPPWLRLVGASYPLFAPLPGWPDDPRFHTFEAVADAGDLRIVLTESGAAVERAFDLILAKLA